MVKTCYCLERKVGVACHHHTITNNHLSHCSSFCFIQFALNSCQMERRMASFQSKFLLLLAEKRRKANILPLTVAWNQWWTWKAFLKSKLTHLNIHGNVDLVKQGLNVMTYFFSSSPLFTKKLSFETMFFNLNSKSSSLTNSINAFPKSQWGEVALSESQTNIELKTTCS